MLIFGAAMNFPATFGAAMNFPATLGAAINLPAIFGAARVLLAAAGLCSFVDDTGVELTFVKLAFLLAMRLLIRDFFSMDIVGSFFDG
jgi:hypothetical protein